MKRTIFLWMSCGLVVLSVIVFGAFYFYRSPQRIAQVPASRAPVQEAVAETPVPPTYHWAGTADDPKYIRLPSIAAEGYVQHVGYTNQQIAVPNNINIAGWFTGSKKPGQSGLSIIDGHVDGKSKPGIFKQLERMSVGEMFSVETGAGRVLQYKVINTATIDVNQALNQLFSQDPHTPSQLNLVTCGGSFSRQTQQYDKRVIVSAALVGK